MTLDSSGKGGCIGELPEPHLCDQHRVSGCPFLESIFLPARSSPPFRPGLLILAPELENQHGICLRPRNSANWPLLAASQLVSSAFNVQACGLEARANATTDGVNHVGKSSLTVQFVEGHFVDSYYPTIENTFSKAIKHRGQDYATEIVDTAGQVSAQRPACPPEQDFFQQLPKAACCSDRPF